MIARLKHNCQQNNPAYHFVKLAIQERSIPADERNEYYEIFHHEDYKNADELKYLLYLNLRANPDQRDESLLSEVLGLSKEEVRHLFRQEPRKVYFPIANGDKSEIVHALVIDMGDVGEFCSFCHSDDKMSALQSLQKATGKRFFVLFSCYFTDRSFMLALAAALLSSPEQLATYAFSGKVNDHGEIFDIQHEALKREACEKHHPKLRYISAGTLKHIKEIPFWLGDGPIPLPWLEITGKTREQAEKGIKDFEASIVEKYPHFLLTGLNAFFGITTNELLLHRESFLPNDQNVWIEYLTKELRPHLESLVHKVPTSRRELHIANSVSTIAVGTGALLGPRIRTVGYQYLAGKYISTIHLSPSEGDNDGQWLRRLKASPGPSERICGFKIETPQKQELCEDLAIGIHLANHNPFGSLKKLLREHPTWQHRKVNNPNQQGNIPLPSGEEDWVRHASELSAILNEAREDFGEPSLHLFLSIPTSIAFGLGLALGHFNDITVYNFLGDPDEDIEKSTFYPTFNLKRIGSPIT